MKNRIKLFAILFFIIITGGLIFQFYKTFEKKNTNDQMIENFPTFSMNNTQGKILSYKDFDKNKWTVFVFFNSQCHYCQEEAQQLNSLKEGFKGISFLWISSEPMEYIIDFQKTSDLFHHPNITFLQDENAQFATNCHISNTPQFLVYNPKGKLIKNHKGAWRIDNLLKNIDNGFKTL